MENKQFSFVVFYSGFLVDAYQTPAVGSTNPFVFKIHTLIPISRFSCLIPLEAGSGQAFCDSGSEKRVSLIVLLGK